ncbi:MAG: hypothetical protein EB125_10605, partial [Betaproteobacteria bacterium]|nr:hypothetical protein [Betaproteobacteria bacterium]
MTSISATSVPIAERLRGAASALSLAFALPLASVLALGTGLTLAPQASAQVRGLPDFTDLVEQV